MHDVVQKMLFKEIHWIDSKKEIHNHKYMKFIRILVKNTSSDVTFPRVVINKWKYIDSKCLPLIPCLTQQQKMIFDMSLLQHRSCTCLFLSPNLPLTEGTCDHFKCMNLNCESIWWGWCRLSFYYLRKRRKCQVNFAI